MKASLLAECLNTPSGIMSETNYPGSILMLSASTIRSEGGDITEKSTISRRNSKFSWGNYKIETLI